MNDINISEKVLSLLEWDSIIQELLHRCKTKPGAAFTASIKPISFDKIKDQLKEITELKKILIQGDIPDLTGVSDIKSFIEYLEKGGILPIENLFLIREFLIAVNRTSRFIKKNREIFKQISEEFKFLNNLYELTDLLKNSITENCEINPKQFPELKKIQGEIFTVKIELKKKLNKLMNSDNISRALEEKVHAIRNDRYVILVKANMKSKVKGTLHDISSSGATLYIEPDEIVGLNNKLIILDRDLKIEINKILKILAGQAGRFCNELYGNLKLLSRFDFLTAASEFSIAIKGNEPALSHEFIIDLKEARHPLLYLMNREGVVSNDIVLGKDHECMIVSGANTGGKTVLLKTIGLCALLILFGLHIPVNPDSTIGAFERILADIGDDQSLTRSLSTFSGQIVVINDILKHANKKSLVLIDEILVGTNPKQGAVLAQAILEELVNTEAKIIVTTHYTELKEMASKDMRIQNASVAFDIETIRPTYKLRTGIPGTSYAIEIAKIYGLSEKIINRSIYLIDEREKTTDALIENMQRHKEEIEEEQRNLEDLKKELSSEIKKYKDLQVRVKIREEELKNEKGIKFIEELNAYRNEINEKIKSQKQNETKELGRILQDIKKVENEVSIKIRKDSKKRFLNKYSPFDHRGVKSGDNVFIVPLAREGIINELNISNKSVEIILGNSIKTRYGFNDLLLPLKDIKADREKKNIKINKNESSESDAKIIPATIQTQYNTCDLRGMKVYEALIKLEADLYRMMSMGINSAVIIHGHGTGALKEAVRNFLGHSNYFGNFRPGEYGEGGDGVSIIILRN